MSQALSPHEGAVHFYRVDARGFTFKEFIWGSSLLTAVLGWLIVKVFRVKLPGSTEAVPVSGLEPFEVDEQGWGQEAWQTLGPRVEAIKGLGFTDPIYHTVFHAPTATLYHMATLRHESGQAMAQVFRRSWQYPRPAKDYVGVWMISAVGGGGFLVTSSTKPDVQLPEDYRVQYETGASNEALWQTHRQRLQDLRAEPITTQQVVREQLVRYHGGATSHQVARGAFRELDSEREDRALGLALGGEPISTARAKREGVLWQIYEQQQSTGTSRSTLMLLFISVILFVVLGGAAWPWRFVLLLIPILFFHELGHLVAMWVFRYRNLKMFFIPLLGAAVTGRHYTVAGWKKTIVYLMGPVPGILVGIAVGIAAMVMDHDLLLELAGLMLILNGFNLLPFPPLDGGWITRILITSRNYMLDIVFRALAGMAMLVLGLALDTRLIWILGLFMLLGLGAVYRVGKVADEVRRRGIVPPPGDADDELNLALIEPLIDGLESQTKRGLTSKTLAQQVLQAYESLYARPPGVLATLGLGTVYVGSFGLAAVFGMVLLMATYVDLGEFMSAAIEQPVYHYNCADASTGQRLDPPDGSITLIASFDSNAEAHEMLASFVGDVPADAQHTVVGQTVFLVLPAGAAATARNWTDRLEKLGGEIVVHRPKAMAQGRLMLFAPSPEIAEEIEHALGGYFSGGVEMALVPPWSREHAYTGEHEQARRTYRLISQNNVDYEDQQLTQLNEQYDDASRYGEEARLAELDAAIEGRMETLREEAKQALLAEHGDTMDSDVVELYDRMPAYADYIEGEDVKDDEFREARSAWVAGLSQRLGRQPDADEDPATHDPDGVYGGYVTRNGMILTVEWCDFNEPAVGLPAMLQWLCDQGVRVQYELYEGIDDYYGY